MAQKSIFESNKTHRTIVRKIIISPIEKLLWPLISRAAFSRKNFASVELSSICNANCVFCAYQFFPKNREKKFMPEDIFKKVVQEVKASKVQRICLQPDLGEPVPP